MRNLGTISIIAFVCLLLVVSFGMGEDSRLTSETGGIMDESVQEVFIFTTSQTSYKIEWLPPVSLYDPFKVGRNIPLKFTLSDLNGNFVFDEGLILTVYNSFGEEIYSASLAFGNIKVEEGHYVAHFKPTLGGKYLAIVETEEKSCLTCHSAQRNKLFGSIDENSINKSLHSSIDVKDGETEDESCIACHYNTTEMGPGYATRLLKFNDSYESKTNSSQYNTYYCTICHFVNSSFDENWVLSTHKPYNVTPVGDPPKVYAHTIFNYMLGYQDIPGYIGRNSFASFSGNRTPECENCHINSVSDPSTYTASNLATVSHYPTYESLYIGGSNTSYACVGCHTEIGGLNEEERSSWGIGSDRSEGLICCNESGHGHDKVFLEWGYDLWGNNNTICWQCHVAYNVENVINDPVSPPFGSFHSPSIDEFIRNCWGCH